MLVTDKLMRELCDIIEQMLKAHVRTAKDGPVRKRKAVVAGQWKHDSQLEPKWVVAEEDDICLVILSKPLAKRYGVEDNSRKAAASRGTRATKGRGASALLESPLTFQMPLAYEIRAQNGGTLRLCVWDPIKGTNRCTS